MTATTTVTHWCACCSKRVGALRTYCAECGDPTNLEFHVEAQTFTRTFPTFAEAVAYAVVRSLSGVGAVNVDALCYSRAAAHSIGCLDDYDADPEASVTSRVTIRATGVGRVA